MNESVLRQWFRRVWNEEDPSAIPELATPDVASHGLMGTIRGADAWLEGFYKVMRQTFSHVQVEMLDEVINGDRIFARLTAQLTPKATGEPVTMSGSCLVRLVDGRIAEAWDNWDFISLLEGMRLLPGSSFAMAITGNLARHPGA